MQNVPFEVACCMSVVYTNSRYKSTTGSNLVQQLFYGVVHELFIYKLLSDISLPVIEQMVFQALRITHFRIQTELLKI